MDNVTVEKQVIGNKEFIAVEPKNNDIINYQLQMITVNNIPNFLEVTRRQNNDKVNLLYDITDKISLEERLERSKLRKIEVIELIDAIVKAEANVRAYQLANKGIIINPEYIFIARKKAEVSFVYLPVYHDDVEAEEIGRLLKRLVIDSHIETTGDSFVQQLLDLVNKDTLSFKDLKDFVKRYKSGSQGKGVHTKPTPINQPSREIPKQTPPSIPPTNPPVTRPQGPTHGNNPGRMENVVPTHNPNGEVHEEKTKSKPSITKIIVFVVLTVVMLAVIAVLFVKGMFVVDGVLKVEYIGAAALAAVAIDFIVFREMFVNNKSKDNKENGNSNTAKKAPMGAAGTVSKKAPMNASVNVPKKPPMNGSVNVPEKTPMSTPSASINIPDLKKQGSGLSKSLGGKKAVAPVEKPERPAPKKTVYNEPAYTPRTNPMSVYDFDDDDSSDTVIMNENGNVSRTYLEYFENGISSKIFIGDESIIVGKQKSRVNYSIPNNRVSKVHAEFGYNADGIYVKDYDSTNGTYINGGSRITPHVEYTICNGDIIRLANVELTLYCI